MTKRKAIEVALVQYDDDGSAEALAERAYDQGRIAGMRQMVNLLPHAGMMRARDTRRKFRAYANALAKKARAK